MSNLIELDAALDSGIKKLKNLSKLDAWYNKNN
jgi:hypothetical protein